MACIVLIDDDDDIRTLVRLSLEMEGHEVHDAAGGLAGLELVRSLPTVPRPVVVLDVQMPDIDGWEVLAGIRAESRTENVPVLMCTVRAGADDREQGFRLGADGFQAKPFDLVALQHQVAKLASLSDDEIAARRAHPDGPDGVP